MGQLVFQAALGGAVNLIGPNISATTNFTLPGADGTNGQALTTNGSGTLGFSSIVSGAAGSNTQVQFNSGGNFGASSSLTWSGTILTSTGFAGPINGTIGATTANTGAFTTVTASTAIGTASGGTGLGGATPFTSGGVVYASSSSALATGSGLTFDGTNFGLGTTSPNTWSTGDSRISTVQGTGDTAINIVSGSGNVGLVVFGSSAVKRSAVLGDNNANLIFYTNTTNSGTSLTAQATLSSSGNLGLGVTPSAWTIGKVIQLGSSVGSGYLYGAGANSSTWYGMNNYYGSGGFTYATSYFATQYRQTSDTGQHQWFNSGTSAGTAGATFTPIQVMTLDASGRLLIGQTSVSNSVNGVYFDPAGGGSSNIVHASGTASGTGYEYFLYAGSVIGSVTQAGTTGVFYNTTSDQRLKENIQDAESASSLIDSLQVRQFDWKSDNSHQRYGFIAQELAVVAPEAVHQPTDTEEMMAVDYSKLVPMLVKEIQSLRQRLSAANL
jgi:hypothetical protein